MTLPAPVATVGSGAFEGCSSLVSVSLAVTTAIAEAPNDATAGPADTALYDLAGRLVTGATWPGLYIRSGKLLRIK